MGRLIQFELHSFSRYEYTTFVNNHLSFLLLGAGSVDDSLDAGENLVEVATLRVDGSDAHVADTEVSRGNVLVEATSNDNVEPGGWVSCAHGSYFAI